MSDPSNAYSGAQKADIHSKRKGLEKAIHQIEQAIKRPKLDSSGEGDEAQKAISGLQELLSRFQGQLNHPSEGEEFSPDPVDREREREHWPMRMPSPSLRDAPDENLALDDAENPLQLLARASDLQLSPVGMRHMPKSPPLSAPPTFPQEDVVDLGEQSAKSFFIPSRAYLDIGDDLDPVELGLVTFDESESLFSLYAMPIFRLPRG